MENFGRRPFQAPLFAPMVYVYPQLFFTNTPLVMAIWTILLITITKRIAIIQQASNNKFLVVISDYLEKYDNQYQIFLSILIFGFLITMKILRKISNNTNLIKLIDVEHLINIPIISTMKLNLNP